MSEICTSLYHNLLFCFSLFIFLCLLTASMFFPNFLCSIFLFPPLLCSITLWFGQVFVLRPLEWEALLNPVIPLPLPVDKTFSFEPVASACLFIFFPLFLDFIELFSSTDVCNSFPVLFGLLKELQIGVKKR